MNSDAIKRAIERHVTPSLPYSVWTVGITNDPERRRGEHGNPSVWYYWEADSERIAREVEEHFLEKGMNGGGRGGITPTYVYIF
jgi:hypothetical protein